jgi:hypothetical protein
MAFTNWFSGSNRTQLFRIDAFRVVNGPLNNGTPLAPSPSRKCFSARGEANMIDLDPVSSVNRPSSGFAQTSFDIGFLTQVAAARADSGRYGASRRATPGFAAAVYDAVDQISAHAWPRPALARLA